MVNILLLFVLLSTTALTQAFDHWAVIVAGSNFYWNYRHQADVCHAYQIMKKNNIPEENIIVLAYDDIANDPENPFPGQIFNKPDGSDVYAGCKIDYRGNQVTPENFLAVIQGNSAAVNGSKVLNSSENSKVFIYFTDHGAPGFVAFPDNKLLYANDFNTAINAMHNKKMYQQMVIYIEACEAGSMFEGILDEHISVYALTAANSQESSWGTYCYPDDMIKGQHVGSCLGDLFSVNWMEDSDAHDLKKETIEEQYEKVKELTVQSHVMQFGDLSFVNESVGNFEGNYNLSKTPERNFFEIILSQAKFLSGLELPTTPNQNSKQHISAIDSRDSKLNHLYYRVSKNANNHKAQLDLAMELTRRMRVDHVFEDFRSKSGNIDDSKKVLPRNFDCLKEMMRVYQQYCEPMDEYDMKYVRYFVQECEALVIPATIDSLRHRIKNACIH